MIKNLIFLSYTILLVNFAVKSRPQEPSLVIFMISVLILSVPLSGAFASSKSPYDSGYDHGCDDAEISDPSDRYINQPEKGPSFHTSEFMNGYYSGFDNCSSSSNQVDEYQSDSFNNYNSGDSYSDNQNDRFNQYDQNRGPAINWENICNDVEFLLPLKEPCNEYANGTQLTEKGKTALVCLLGGATAILSTLNPMVKEGVMAAGQMYCP
jgi:hypothetical protein